MKQLFYWCLFLFPLPAYLQTTCGEAVYRQILQDANRNFGDGDFRQAYEKYRAARGCSEANFNLIDSLMDAALLAVDHQRERAERAEKDARRNLSKANRLVAYFNFGDENAAWAYNTQNGRFGVIDRNGQLLSKSGFIYESPASFHDGIALARVDNQVVFVSDHGVEISDRYDYIIPTLHDRYVASKSYIKMIINNQGEPMHELLPDYKQQKNEPFTFIIKEGRTGLLDAEGEIFIKPEYEEVEIFANGMAAVKKNGLWGFIDSSGFERIAPKYKDRGWFSEGRAAIKMDKKWGYINKKGKEVIPCEFNDAAPFFNGFAHVNKDGKFGIIDTNGVALIPFKYQRLQEAINDYFVIENGTSKISIDTFGKKEILLRYLQSYTVLNGLFKVEKAKKWGLVDQDGWVVVLPQYDEIKPFSEKIAAVRKGGLWGLINRSGEEVIVPQYENIINQTGGPANVVKQKKCGLINQNGNLITDIEFDKVVWFSEGLGAIVKDGKWGFVDQSGRVVIFPEYEIVEPFFWGVSAVYANSKWNFIDREGTYMIEEPQRTIWPISEKLAIVMKERKWGLIDRQGKIILKPQYEEIGLAIDKRMGVQLKGLWGLVDETGREIISPQYERMMLQRTLDPFGQQSMGWEFSDQSNPDSNVKSDGQRGRDLIPVQLKGQWGAIDSNGYEVIAPVYNEISVFSEGRARVRKNAKWGFVDDKGNIIVPIQYDVAMDYSDGFAWVNIGGVRNQFGMVIGGQWAAIDKDGNEVIAQRPYDQVRNFQFNFATVKQDGYWGLINKTGQEIIPPKFDDLGVFTNNLLWINQKAPCLTDGAGKEVVIAGDRTLCDLFGFIDSTGKILSLPQYQLISELSDGRIKVAKNTKWGFVDSSGTEVISATYNHCNDFSEGLAVVLMEKKWGVIDKFGRVVVPFRYERIEQFSGGLALVQQKDVYGYIDKKGREVIPVRYTAVEPPTDGLIKVNMDGKWGLIDLQGRVILPCQYQLYRCGYRQYLLEQNGRWGLFAPEFGILIEPAYEAIGYVGEESGWVRVKQNGRWGWVDGQGQTMIPCRFDAATPFTNKHARVFQSLYPGSFYINTKGEMILGYNGPK